jgi:hypothetical protein
MRRLVDRFILHLFVLSVLFLVFSYGTAVGMLKIFPYQLIVEAEQGYKELCVRCGIVSASSGLLHYYWNAPRPCRPAITNTGRACPGVNLVTQIGPNRTLVAKIMDLDGITIQQWDIDWFKIWPDPDYLPAYYRPKSPPGTIIHGAVILPNGNLVFNFEHLGMVCLDRRGQVVWRLPYQTHHSICLHEDGNLWACGSKEHFQKDARFPNRIPPFREDTIVVVTPEGRIAREWSVNDILLKNGYMAMMYLHNLDVASTSTLVKGDVLHLNDVEPFPWTKKEGFFKKGDVMVSLRNVNTVFVFDQESEKIKFISTGRFIRQHDPDFIDGDTISVFENHNIGYQEFHPQSRIVIMSAVANTLTTYYEGRVEHPFYTSIGGKHQWLPNGNLLITETWSGRAFEINRTGEVVWEYLNYVNPGVLGVVQEVQRMPLEYAKLYSK